MGNCMVTAFVHGGENDLHVEFSPSLLLDSERRGREDCRLHHNQLHGYTGARAGMPTLLGTIAERFM
jgi:hypothetical protein